MSVAVAKKPEWAVQQGRSSLAVRKDDFYETPECATEALCRVEKVSGLHVWEPACGQGAISKILDAHGAVVWSTDLVDRGFGDGGVDFLMEHRAPWTFDAIITNPPFKLATGFIRQALRFAPTVIIFSRWAYAEGSSRSDIIDGHLSHVWLGIERLPFMHRVGYEGPKRHNSGAPFAWFVFKQQKSIPDGFIVRRMSWWPA